MCPGIDAGHWRGYSARFARLLQSQRLTAAMKSTIFGPEYSIIAPMNEQSPHDINSTVAINQGGVHKLFSAPFDSPAAA
jgi:hypothetical protein